MSENESQHEGGTTQGGITRRGLLGGALGAAALPLLGGTAFAQSDERADPPDHAPGPPEGVPPRARVLPGIEVLDRDDYSLLEGQRVGLISNPTGILPDLRHEFDVMHAADNVDLVAGFGPEHGFRGAYPPGGHDGYFIDPRTGVPVYDSYTADAFAQVFEDQDIDTVVFDIQDIGPRFYTYIWTMYRSMHGAALAGRRYVVLDRPNPISALDAHGPMLDYPDYASGVGWKPIAMLHGMTVGELAQLFNAELIPEDAGDSAELEVVEMERWERDMFYEETGLPWVLPSPNIPTVDSAVVYPGTCVFEGTNLSEGRGTSRPFELIGAPFIDHEWAEALNEQGLDGVVFREAYFQPTANRYQGETCAGVQLHVTDREAFEPIRTGMAMLVTAKAMYGEHMEWTPIMDLLMGSDYVRTSVDDGKAADEIVAGWQDDLDDFRSVRAEYLIY